MLKTWIGGIAVGLANIIPGVSGGTMMVILGLFDKVMRSIDGLVRIKSDTRKDDLIFLLVLGSGAIVGLVAFAKLLEIAFTHFPTQTMFAFVGMVGFSIPPLVKKEMKNDKIEWIPILIGATIIFTLMYLAPSQKEQVIQDFPALNIGYLVSMLFLGMIAGGAMFLPGVSGSMIMLILGKYYLFKSLLANVTSFQLDILLPLFFMGIGILVGIIVVSKIIKYCLTHFHSKTMNVILGLVIASSVVLIPFNVNYDLMLVITSLGALLFGGLLVMGLEKIS